MWQLLRLRITLNRRQVYDQTNTLRRRGEAHRFICSLSRPQRTRFIEGSADERMGR